MYIAYGTVPTEILPNVIVHDDYHVAGGYTFLCARTECHESIDCGGVEMVEIQERHAAFQALALLRARTTSRRIL